MAANADAQIRAVAGPADGWISGFAGRYMEIGNVADPETNSTWIFGEAWAFGAGYHRSLVDGLAVGVDLGIAAPRYERRGPGNIVLPDATGRATIVSPQASGRFNYGGAAAGLAFYLTGAIGSMIYRIPDLDRWDPDLSLYAGTGINYQPSSRRAYFLEWGRYWVYHQGTGLESNRAHHSLIRLGLRFGH
jgi:hypothetical protein